MSDVINKKQYNCGVATLKFIMAFCVVFCHFGGQSVFSIVCNYAVPVFVIIAFFLGGKLWDSLALGDLKTRIVRLMIPFWGWGCFYCITDAVITKKFKLMEVGGQLLYGHTICPPLYFLLLCVIFTILIFIICKLFRAYSIYVLISLFVFCNCAQYFGCNYAVVSRIPDTISESRYTIGRIAELFPSAVLGFLYCRYCGRCSRIRYWVIFTGVIMFIASLILRPYITPTNGYLYQGIHLQLGALGLVVTAHEIGKIDFGAKICGIIKVVTMPLLGVYCLHMFVGRIITVFDIFSAGFLFTSIIFIASLALSLLLVKIRFVKNFFC